MKPPAPASIYLETSALLAWMLEQPQFSTVHEEMERATQLVLRS